MRILKKMLSPFVLFIILINIVGCNNYRSFKSGNYIEYFSKKPKEIEKILYTANCKDKTINLLGINEEKQICYYTSNNKGVSWKKQKMDWPKDEIIDEKYIRAAAVNSNNEIAILFTKSTEQEDRNVLTIRNKEGKFIDINIKDIGLNYVDTMKFSPNGDLFLLNVNADVQSIYQIEKETNKVKYQYTINDVKAINFTFIEDTLIFATFNAVMRYDIKTGNMIEKIEELKGQMNNSPFITSNGKDKVYFLGEKGLQVYLMDEKVTKITIKKSTSMILVDNAHECKDITYCKNGNFFGRFPNKTSDGTALVYYRYNR